MTDSTYNQHDLVVLWWNDMPRNQKQELCQIHYPDIRTHLQLDFQQISYIYQAVNNKIVILKHL